MLTEHNGLALPIDTMLQEYKIESILGVGGFGITYLAIDINLDKYVAIKEFMPDDIAFRQADSTVVPKSQGHQRDFEEGIAGFLEEAKTLAKFTNHPNIVKISRLFRANDTAYFVMDFEEGQDLGEYLKQNSSALSEEEIYNIIMPILDGLREVHSIGFLHRDLKPANIFFRDNGSPMLIDFGASRIAIGIKTKSISALLTEGYAPKEQYSRRAKQGAYTDIYAIGAVMYKMATGKRPIESSERANAITDDELDPYQRLQDMVNIPYSDNFKKAVDWALEFRGKDRPQSARELQGVLVSMQSQEVPDKILYKKPPKESTYKVIFDDIIIIDGLMYQNTRFTTQYTWKKAQEYAKNLRLGGYDDWRLPTRAELHKIANIELYGEYDNSWIVWLNANRNRTNINSKGDKHFIKKEFIENMPSTSWFWTSEEYDSSSAWVVSFEGGNGYWYAKSSKGYALCVRG